MIETLLARSLYAMNKIYRDIKGDPNITGRAW